MDSFFLWKQSIEEIYKVNPNIFILLYLITIIPCWWVLFQIIQFKKNRKKILSLILVELFLLVCPYLYILIAGEGIPLWVILCLVLLIFGSFYSLYKKIKNGDHNRNASNIFWDIYSKFYKATIYQSLPHLKMFETAVKGLSLTDGLKVLDAGCGAGDVTDYLIKEEKSIEIYGIDFSEEMLKKARSRFSGIGVNFQRADLSEPLPLNDESFDRLVCVSVLFAVPDIEKTLKEFCRILKNGSIMVLVEPTPQFNYMKILDEHLKETRKLSFFKRIQSYLLIIIKLPILFILFIMNIFMDHWAKKGLYHYYEEGEMNELLKKVGFSRIETKKILSQQDIMYIISK